MGDRVRPDVPHVGLFNRYEDAQEQARFRADITGRRYRVRFDRANRWWNITETTLNLIKCNCQRNELGMVGLNSGHCAVHPLPGCPNPACGETWIRAFHGDRCDSCGWVAQDSGTTP